MLSVHHYRPVAHRSDAVVALGDEPPRTAGMLARDVLTIAARLPPASPNSEVLIVCDDRYRVAVAVLAAWQAGHAAALPPNAASETVRALRRRPGVVALLHDHDLADPDDLRPRLAAVDHEPTLDPAQLGPIASDRVIATVYTSGSTGAHQACPKTARQLLGEAATLAERFAVGPQQRVLATVPPHHLYGLLFGVLVPLCAGASFIRETPLHTETVAAVARRFAADMLVSAPVHLRSLTLLSPGELPPLGRVFSSGAALPGETARLLGTRLGLWVTEIYGASETGGIAWRRHAPGKPAGDLAGHLPWEPLPGVHVAADADGGLLLTSPFLSPDVAAPLACADQIELAADGRFRLLGRRDDILKIGGKRVALAEVEQRALALPEVADVAVAMVAVGEPRGHEIVAAIVPADPRHDAADLIARVRHGLLQWFDPVVVPRRIRVVPALPREASGKLTRANLLRLFERPVTRDSSRPRPAMQSRHARAAQAESALEALTNANRIAFAPFVFQAACVMRDRGILAALDGSKTGLTLEEVAARVELSIYGTRVLLEAGLGIGVVVEVEGRYRLTKTAVFLQHDPMTRANMDFTRDVNYAGLAGLGEAIATGKPAGLKVFGEWDTVYQALAHLPEPVRKSWFAFDHHYSDGAFGAALPLVFRDRPRRILDIGGNTGKWAKQCLNHDPEVVLTLMDLPGQLRNARDSLDAAGLLPRVRFHEANLLDAACEVPGGHDIIWMSQFLDCFSEPEIVSILRRCAAALAPGAAIYILEAFWDRQRFPAASFCLQMTSLYFTAIANGNSQMYRSDTFLACVREAGLEVVEQHDGLGVSHTLLVCRPPRG
jgi:4-coumarate--CoA ligase (photoactive yellow protein activation family)